MAAGISFRGDPHTIFLGGGSCVRPGFDLDLILVNILAEASLHTLPCLRISGSAKSNTVSLSGGEQKSAPEIAYTGTLVRSNTGKHRRTVAPCKSVPCSIPSAAGRPALSLFFPRAAAKQTHPSRDRQTTEPYLSCRKIRCSSARRERPFETSHFIQKDRGRVRRPSRQDSASLRIFKQGPVHHDTPRTPPPAALTVSLLRPTCTCSAPTRRALDPIISRLCRADQRPAQAQSASTR